MADYSALKQEIDSKVYENTEQDITGAKLNSVLKQMVDVLGEGYQFVGVATTDTIPQTTDAKVFYIANGKGTYTNFGGIDVTEDDVVVLYWDSSWHKVSTGIASQEKLSELEEDIENIGVKSDNTASETDLDVSDENGNVLARFADGHVLTKNFDSKNVTERLEDTYTKEEVDEITEDIEHPVAVEDNIEDSDLDVSDENGNVLARFADGHVLTKNFDSKNTISYTIID